MGMSRLCYSHGSTVASGEISKAEHSNPPRFGSFELDPRAGELLREGKRIRLQQQSLEILLMLLEHPGEPVLREEIRNRLWPNGTLVEFDHSINSAIKKLRQALEDDAEEPRYIETLARRGYRFIASVDGLVVQSPAALQPATEASPQEMEEKPKPTSARPRRWKREATAWTLFGIASLALIIFAAVSLVKPAGKAGIIRYEIPLPEGVRLGSLDIPIISPNGRLLVFTGPGADGKRRIWFRSLDSLTTYALPETEGAFLPFWSPDSRFVAFWAASTLKKIDVTGGRPVTLWDLTGLFGFVGGTWNQQGVILISAIDRDHPVGLYRLSDKGGTPAPALPFDKSRHEKYQWFPQFLPDGRHFIYFSLNTDAGKGTISLGSLDSRQSRSLINTESNVRYVAPGYLVYGRQAQETLFVQPFDPEKLQVTGEPITIEGVARAPDNPASLFSTSENGVLVYASPSWPKYQLAWYDRKGVRKQSVGEACIFGNLALSPDEKHVAMFRPSPPLGNYDVWILDLLSGVFSRVTTHPDDDEFPVWSPDGHELIFSSGHTGEELRLFRKVVGGGDEEQILKSETGEFARKTAHQIPRQWLADGSILFTSSAGSDTGAFYLWPRAERRKPVLLLKTDFAKGSPRVSKDGRWVAYESNESGRMEIYIARFPTFTGKREVSNEGGLQPRWRNDGKELFYLGSDGEVMSVDVKGTEELETGAPRILFKATMKPGEYCVTGDGERFLIGKPVEQPKKPLVIVHNWVSELRP
jgi:DNA-binding winged helix-turn-helix (wHTH) protein/Tol biopolymer transport system component